MASVTSGSATMFGDDPWDLSAETKARLAYVPQQVQYYAVLWQFLEGVNATRACVQSPIPFVSTGVIVQPNLVARQTAVLIDDYEAGRPVL